MANLLRVAIAYLLTLASFAFAQGTVPQASLWTIGLSGGAIVTGDTISAACAAFASAATAATNGQVQHIITNAEQLTDTTGKCDYDQMFHGTKIGENTAPASRTLSCPDNSVLQGETCLCNEGYNPRRGQCVKPDDRTLEQICEDESILYNSTLQASRFMRVSGQLSQFADGGLTCADSVTDSLPPGTGCKHWFTGDLGFQDDQGNSFVNGHSVALGKGDPRGGASLVCSTGEGSDPPKEDPPPDDCKQGYKGQVNGVDVCVEAWTGDTEGNDWERTTDGEGNKTDNKTNIKCKGDQCTVTQTTTTTKPDGTVTTTTTVTEDVNRQGYCARNPESSVCRRTDDESGGDKGPATRGGGDGEGLEGFCKEKPNSPLCKESSFGGSCAASFQCDGDAIQCAIAKEQHVRACKLFDESSAESDLYNAEKNKEGPRTDDLPGNRQESMANRISTADALGGGQCVQDLDVVVAGFSVTLPMSKVCPIVSVIGNLMIGVALLLAVRIIGRG